MRMFLLFVLISLSIGAKAQVSETMDKVFTRLYEKYTPAQLDTLSENTLLAFLEPDEKQTLAQNYWNFTVNVPVTVSVIRHKKQETLPFWLKTAGFELTKYSISNEMYEYEVWQKDFQAGKVNLGINGFDKHRPVYLVSLKPKRASDKLIVSSVFPEKQHFEILQEGAFTYHDWDGLTLNHVDTDLKGDILLTTVRGRAREAHVMKALRKTDFPSSPIPDQVLQTWTSNPENSIDISWRTQQSVKSGLVKYWINGSADTLIESASTVLLEDRLIYNDRYVNRFKAHLSNLKPGTTYQFRIEGDSLVRTFKTASPSQDFSFVWFGDTHNDRKWGQMLQSAHKKHPETEFYAIAGDLVNTGLHRDDWDAFFAYSGTSFAEKPLIAIPGNHDSQDGLGAELYRQLLPFPANGPAGFPSGLTYAFNYKSALFLMIDAASFSTESQTAWIEQQLKNSKATWKFLFVHFPPFNEVEEYPEMVDKWVPLFDKYGVDIVISGHFHYYLRTYPLKNGQKHENGTVYMTSVGTSAAREAKSNQPFVFKRFENGNFYQQVEIKDKKLKMRVFDSALQEIDFFELSK